ncbi:hypothetical protein [Methylobacterium sp. CCH7-A2]|jgi:hypothetical protein|uniref:hypothetical protein n=1 Tax=Methylobacterium sp. CCH7-A2 TaxID=1768789 RepID=UPI00082B000E|nr:hypothetical protein [Methylobacterium sp. CCH7-A2]
MPRLPHALAAALAGLLLLPAPATARITDRDLSCAEWLKSGARGTSEYPAATQARIRAFCAANPTMKAIDAEMTMTRD